MGEVIKMDLPQLRSVVNQELIKFRNVEYMSQVLDKIIEWDSAKHVLEPKLDSLKKELAEWQAKCLTAKGEFTALERERDARLEAIEQATSKARTASKQKHKTLEDAAQSLLQGIENKATVVGNTITEAKATLFAIQAQVINEERRLLAIREEVKKVGKQYGFVQ